VRLSGPNKNGNMTKILKNFMKSESDTQNKDTNITNSKYKVRLFYNFKNKLCLYRVFQ
jgi:hypothetical protein